MHFLGTELMSLVLHFLRRRLWSLAEAGCVNHYLNPLYGNEQLEHSIKHLLLCFTEK